MTRCDDVRLPAYDHRQGIGPTTVLLHYWGGSARTWDLVASRLDQRDFLSIDFRGWGRSSDLPGPYTLRQLAHDTLAVLADTAVTDYVLVGHSMGGKVAQLIAAVRPAGLRGIVLVAPGPASPPPHVTPEFREGLSHAYDSDESIASARDDVLTATTLSGSVRDQILRDSRSYAKAAVREWPLRGIAEDITEQTRNIDVPVLVIAGENDCVEPVDVLRRHLLPYLGDAECAYSARWAICCRWRLPPKSPRPSRSSRPGLRNESANAAGVHFAADAIRRQTSGMSCATFSNPPS